MVAFLNGRSLFPRFAKVLVAALLIALFPAASVMAAEVEAQLDRDSVPAGNGAILTLRVSGGRIEQPKIPAVENFIIDPRGRSQHMQIVNGKTTVSFVYSYVVGSTVPGEYQIPAVEIMIDGEKHATQPLKLKVLDSAAAQPPAGAPATPAGGQAGEGEADRGEKSFGFLTVELAGAGRKHAYVGEIAPVIIRAWLPEDSQAQIRSQIQPEAKGFTLHNVSDQPQQSREVRDGKRYLVVTWFGGMSATKAGKLPASLSVDATVAIRDTSAPKRPRRRTGGPFDDPFFDDAFDNLNVPMIQKDVTLKSDDQEIEVRALPVEGRPAGFTGAVGEFKFEGVKLPNNWKTGEPQQITARLSGSGNFSLMKAPQPAPADAWKTYPGKDEFSAGDQASFAGSKTFQFSAVPRKGGAQELVLAFSYFDPAAEAYKTITSSSQKIQVSGNDIVDVEPAAAPSVKEPEKKAPGLVAQHVKMSPQGALVPLVSRPAFIPLLGFSGLLCVMGGLLAWLRRRRGNPDRRAAAAVEKATREALKAVAAAKDATGYFTAARSAIQHRLGALWNQPPQAITLAEVAARMPGDSPVARFFREADCFEYSRQAGGEILPEWRSLLDEALASLTQPAR
jgi:hypothetical protein